MNQHIIDDENHHNDPRVACTRRNGLDVDTKRMIAVITVEDDEGDEHDVDVPIKFEVCGVCDGKGTHVNPSIDSGGLTREDFAEDPDFAESYFSGAYDMQCECCHGNNVMPVLVEDDARLSQKQKYAIQYQYDMDQHEADHEAECAAERRMGC